MGLPTPETELYEVTTVNLTKSQLIEALCSIFNKTGGLVYEIKGDVDIRIIVGDPRERRDVLTEHSTLQVRWTNSVPKKEEKKK